MVDEIQQVLYTEHKEELQNINPHKTRKPSVADRLEWSVSLQVTRNC